ncbi:MAG: hypothetical protein V4482_02925 [Pseudomonadota bacterium]
MSALLDQVNKGSMVKIPADLYSDHSLKQKGRIRVRHYDLKIYFDKIAKRVEEQKEMLLIVQQNDESLKERVINREISLAQEIAAEGEDLTDFKRLMRKEDRKQRKINKRQDKSIGLHIRMNSELIQKLLPYVKRMDTLTAGSITHDVLLAYAKKNEPAIFDVPDSSINMALVHLFGEKDPV